MKETRNSYRRIFRKYFQKDDQKSFEKLFKLFYERLLNFCVHFTRNREIAEEIVSDVLFKIWEKRKELSHVLNLETYLFIMVKNKSINYTRQFSNYRFVYLEETGSHELLNINDPGKELEKRELIFKMDQAIETLPHQCKIVFSLIKEEGLKYKEVATILDISPRTVETQLVRAMQKLDKILSPYILSQEADSKKESESHQNH